VCRTGGALCRGFGTGGLFLGMKFLLWRVGCVVDVYVDMEKKERMCVVRGGIYILEGV
jgi:hypothetical protein